MFTVTYTRKATWPTFLTLPHNVQSFRCEPSSHYATFFEKCKQQSRKPRYTCTGTQQVTPSNSFLVIKCGRMDNCPEEDRTDGVRLDKWRACVRKHAGPNGAITAPLRDFEVQSRRCNTVKRVINCESWEITNGINPFLLRHFVSERTSCWHINTCH
jgi:hypothetical protein